MSRHYSDYLAPKAIYKPVMTKEGINETPGEHGGPPCR